MSDDSEKVVRLDLTFSDEAYREVQRMAKDRGKDIPSVISDALRLDRWYERTRKEGTKVILKKRDGRSYQFERAE